MYKKYGILCLAFFFFIAIQGNVHAGNFTTLASTGALNLGEDAAWSRAYKTDGGEFKIQFRKLKLGDVHKRYHLIIWWNDERIADGYCPENDPGYGFKIFKDTGSNRIFVSLETKLRLVLLGYEPKTKKMIKYVDSKDYDSYLPYPLIGVDGDGDLRLTYINKSSDKNNVKYKLFWDAGTNWFGYKDITEHKTIPEPVEEYPESVSISIPDYGTEAPEYNEPSAAETSTVEELYYEEVVGS